MSLSDSPLSGAEDCDKQEVQYEVKKFSAFQSCKLNQLYWSGMRGVGKQYQHLLHEATLQTNLSLIQVKVRVKVAIAFLK